MAILSCPVCTREFTSNDSRKKYCSKRCGYKGKPSASNLTCAICSGPMVNSRTSKDQGEAAHNKCRASVGGLRTHGTSGYHGGCRCGICAAGQAQKMADYAASFRAENGLSPSAAFRLKFLEANGHSYPRGLSWISPKLRFELYERDGWTCYLCSSPVDRDGDLNGNRAPSLDHVIPRSKGGTHDPSNLKTACRSCNSRKGATHVLV